MTRATKPRVRVAALRKALEAYWRSVDVWSDDVHFYTQEEWRDRGETYGVDGRLSVTFEGPLYEAMNHLQNLPGQQRFEIAERTRQIAEEHGLWFELGYAWSMSFYPFD